MYLLDTHTIIWYLSKSSGLTNLALKLIEQQNCVAHIVSFWEIAVKVSLGKLLLNASIAEMIDELKQQEIEILPVNIHALEIVQNLPFHHRDPFDRLLIAEALIYNLTIISADTNLDNYKVQRIW